MSLKPLANGQLRKGFSVIFDLPLKRRVGQITRSANTHSRGNVRHLTLIRSQKVEEV